MAAIDNRVIFVNSEITIPLSELEFSYVRSSGPGGQNVNKVNSKAMLRWNIAESSSLNEETRIRLMLKLIAKINTDGELILMSDRFRDQIRNRDDCIEKLRLSLIEAAHKPKPRKKTKPSRSRKLKNAESKKKHSNKKSQRRSVRTGE